MRFIKLMYLSDRKAMELYGFPIVTGSFKPSGLFPPALQK